MKYLPHSQADLQKVLDQKEGIMTCKVVAAWSNLGIPKTTVKNKKTGEIEKLDNPIKDVTLLLDPENPEHEALMAYAKQAYDVGLEKMETEEGVDPEEFSREPFFIKKDKDREGMATGLRRWTINRKVAGVNRKTKKDWTWKIPVVDSQGRPVPEHIAEKIGPESVVRVAFQFRPWQYSNKYGVTADLDSVMLLSLSEKPSSGGVEWEAEEEGFTVDEAETNAFAEAAEGTSEGDY